MLTKGDKLILAKDHQPFFMIGDICTVTDVNENTATLQFENGSMVVSNNLIDENFKKMEEKHEAIPAVTEELVDAILENSEIHIDTVFDKCTVVSCKLPNGFVIVESCGCVSPENYDLDTGVAICMDRITDKIWELEGYKLQDELYQMEICNECNCCEACDDCDWDWDCK